MREVTIFRDRIRKDAEAGVAWFNEEEFAEWHDVNGKRLLCVFCSDRRMTERSVSQGGKERERPEGIHLNRGVLFLRSDDVVGVPKRGQKFKIDGRLYVVDGAQLIGGAVLRIETEANDA